MWVFLRGTMPGPHVRRGPGIVAGQREDMILRTGLRGGGGVPTSFVVDTFLPLPDTFLLIS